MTLKLSDARLDVYYPGNSSDLPGDADLQVSPPDFEFLRVEPRLQDLVDVGEVHIHNRAGTYTGNITSGDRVRFLVQREGDSALTHVWTGMVRTIHYDELGANDAIMRCMVDDFVFGVMDIREVVQGFTNDQVAGASDAILETILADDAPEIDRSQIATFTDLASPIYNGTILLQAVNDLADRVNAVLWSDDRALRFEPLSGLASAFTLGTEDRGLASNVENDDQMVNRLRVYGGTGSQVENTQTSVDQYITVSNTNQLQIQIETRKSEISKIEVWTRPLAGSTDDLLVRVQANDPTSNLPVAPDDRESDAAAKRLSQEFLANDDWTTFIMPDHTLPDVDPWILIEALGSTGQEVGADTNGVPAYRQYFPFPTDLIVQDNPSIAEYRARERGTRRTDLKDRTRLAEFGDSVLNRAALPDKEFTFPAESDRAHKLVPGDIVTVPSTPRLNASGDHIVTVVRHQYEGSDLDTTVTLQETATV